MIAVNAIDRPDDVRQHVRGIRQQRQLTTSRNAITNSTTMNVQAYRQRHRQPVHVPARRAFRAQLVCA